MSNLTPLIAATWGFCGAVPYSGTRLVTALWSNAEVTPTARKLALGKFMVAMFTGTTFAAAFAPSFAPHLKIIGGHVEPTGFLIGAMANALWRVLSSQAFVAKILAGLGGWFLNASKNVSKDAADEQ